MMWLGCVLALGIGWWLGTLLEPLAGRLVLRWAADATNRPYRRLARPYIPGISAAVTAALWLRYGFSPALLPAAALALWLILVAAIDIDRRLVLNELLLAGLALALVRAAAEGMPGLLAAALGGAVGLGLFLIVALAGRGALGFGDVKLAALLGVALGYPTVLRALFLAILAGGVAAALLLLTRRVKRNAMIPYAPFLAVGGVVGLLLR